MIQVPRWAIAALSGVLVAACTLPLYAQQGQYQGEVVGKVKSMSVDQHQLTVRDADNRDWIFTLNDSTQVQVHNQQGKLGDLKVGERVDVVYSMDGYVPKMIETLPKDKPVR